MAINDAMSVDQVPARGITREFPRVRRHDGPMEPGLGAVPPTGAMANPPDQSRHDPSITVDNLSLAQSLHALIDALGPLSAAAGVFLAAIVHAILDRLRHAPGFGGATGTGPHEVMTATRSSMSTLPDELMSAMQHAGQTPHEVMTFTRLCLKTEV